MTLDEILEIATECVENERIPTEGLTIMYRLEKEDHKKLDEELFYKVNNNRPSFSHNKEIEIDVAGITFSFKIKKKD